MVRCSKERRRIVKLCPRLENKSSWQRDMEDWWLFDGNTREEVEEEHARFRHKFGRVGVWTPEKPFPPATPCDNWLCLKRKKKNYDYLLLYQPVWIRNNTQCKVSMLRTCQRVKVIVFSFFTDTVWIFDYIIYYLSGCFVIGFDFGEGF